MSVQVVSVVVLLLTVIVKARVSISGLDVTMTCPKGGKWFKAGTPLQEVADESESHTIIYDETNKGPYHCEYGEEQNKEKYYFYVQGKLCKHCYDVNGVVFALVIIGDVIGTVVVMVIIYRCTKKKSSGGSTPSAKTPPRAAGRGPPVPSPDYEPLNPHTRSHDPYSTVHKMG